MCVASRAARAEASRHGAGAPSRCSLPRASNARMLRERDAIALFVRVDPLRTPKTKRPRVLEPEGVHVASGDRGDRSPRCERISRWRWCRGNSAGCEAAARRAVRTRAGPHRASAMACRLRCGRRASWNSCRSKVAARAKAAHLTRVVSIAQQFFYAADERRSAPASTASRKTARTLHSRRATLRHGERGSRRWKSCCCGAGARWCRSPRRGC